MITLHLIVLALAYLTFYLFTNYVLTIDFLTLLQTTTNSEHQQANRVPPNPELPQPPSCSVLHKFQQAAVCSDSAVCSQVGSNILRQNGGAVDAAIATLLCNGLLTQQSMSLGGGMLMLYYSRREQISHALLGREVAPLATNLTALNSLNNASLLLRSVHTIAVPAEVMAYAEAHQRFGKLDWSQLVEPTLNICRTGFLLSKHQRDALNTNRDMVLQDANLRQMFVNTQTNDFYAYGSHIQPTTELCQTYELLMRDGARSFYKGELSHKILADLKDMGSVIDREDFENLLINVTTAVTKKLGKHVIHMVPPPGSGLIIGFVMNILQHFAQDFSRAPAMGEQEIHRIVEALKFGFVERWQLETPIDNDTLTRLLNGSYAEQLAALIKNISYEDPKHYGANMSLVSYPEHGTAHISILAPNGDAVSVTSSINYYFGSGRTGRRTGFVFNNAMSDFKQQHINNYFDLPNMENKNLPFAARSPISSMSPLIITDLEGNVRLVIGAAGGTKIISVLTQLLVRILWMRENIKEAIDAARFHHQLLPNTLEYEYGLMQQHITALKSRGHKVKRYRERGSAVCAIERKNSYVFANVDFRKDGGVSGF